MHSAANYTNYVSEVFYIIDLCSLTNNYGISIMQASKDLVISKLILDLY